MVEITNYNTFLNFSEKNNCFVLTPPKTGSRNITRILKFLDFNTYGWDDNKFIFINLGPRHNHTLKLMEDHLNHQVIITCRNPYAILASMFRLSMLPKKTIRSTFNIKDEFIEFLKEYLFYNESDPWLIPSLKNSIDQLKKRKIDHRIKLESFSENIMQIPFIKNYSQETIDQIEMLSKEKHGDYRDIQNHSNIENYFPSDFKLYYKQESAEIVYTTFKDKFIIMDYHKDSWMS